MPISDNLIYALLAYGLIPALSEEFFFRGIFYAECADCSTLAAILISSLAFSLAYFNLSAFPFYFVSGVLLAYLRHLTKSLVAPIAVRFFVNVLSIYVMPTLWRLLTQPLGVLFAVFVSIVLFLFSLFLFLKALGGFYLKLSRDPERENDVFEPFLKGIKACAPFFQNPIFLVTVSISIAVMIIKIFI